MQIDIIGAGIGGLTTAIALDRKNIAVKVYEQAQVIKPVGAGIMLANNAMQVYEKLGLREVIEEKGNTISSMNITTEALKNLSQVKLGFFERKYGVKNVAIHRGELQQLLVNELKVGQFELDHRLQTIEKGDGRYELIFEKGQRYHSNCLVGADGIHSKVRAQVVPESTIRNPHQLCWRGVTIFRLPAAYRHELNEAWGKGNRFGFVQIAEEQVYWYALQTYQQKEEYQKGELAQYFGDYHPLIRELIEATPPESIHTTEIIDLKPLSTWHQNQICLIGDAAHATTPNMGQGACQAIEDAYILAECLSKYDIPTAFNEYSRMRMPKAQEVVKRSWMLGKVAHMQHPLAVYLRNQLFKVIPDFLNRQQMERIIALPKK